MVAGIGGALERVAAAYRTGEGVAYPHFGAAFRKVQAGINRPAFLTYLVTRRMPAIPDVHEALISSRVRVARPPGPVSYVDLGRPHVSRANARRQRHYR